jgi:N-acetyl-anhydromuramyl-L-alanine amidase AmpD
MQIKDVRSSLPLNPNPKRRYETRDIKDITKIALHCTGPGAPELMPLARYDITPRPDHHISPLACPGFTYHYYIDEDIVYYTSSLENITWHAGTHNKNSIGVCMRYKSKDNPNPPSKKQLQAVYDLLVHLCLKLGITPDRIRGHRELWGTGWKMVNGTKKLRKTCPGLLVDLHQMRYTVSRGIQKFLVKTKLYKGPVDGDFGPKSIKAFRKYQKRK